MTNKGSSVDFFVRNANELKKYCSEIWVDGGVRKKSDIETAYYLGASQVLVARPFITDICFKGEIDLTRFVE